MSLPFVSLTVGHYSLFSAIVAYKKCDFSKKTNDTIVEMKDSTPI